MKRTIDTRAAKGVIASLAFAAALGTAPPASADAEPFVGDVIYVGFNYCPRHWAEANGQLLPIAQNTALFSLLGVTYGGDGRVTFALPDLRGRAPVHFGPGPGLTPRTMGEQSGTEVVTLSAANLPPHSHDPRINVSRVDATLRNPINAYVARAATDAFEKDTLPQGHQMAPDAIVSQTVGSGLPVANMQPYAVVRACIALNGVFPSRP